MVSRKEIEEIARDAIVQAEDELGEDATYQEIENRSLETMDLILRGADVEELVRDSSRKSSSSPPEKSEGIFAVLDDAKITEFALA